MDKLARFRVSTKAGKDSLRILWNGPVMIRRGITPKERQAGQIGAMDFERLKNRLAPPEQLD
jgi:hypothetical protein